MPQRVPGETQNLAEVLRAELEDLVPRAFADGVLNIDALRTALGHPPEATPGFSFTWPSIEQARLEARAATTARLAPDVKASVDWENAANILIEGDNLQVLKLLRRGYAQSVKLIYIDPPYNTGETFTYSDDYAVAEPDYLRESGQVDAQGRALSTKLERAGRKHDPWLTMMFPRLAAARYLLRRDGAIMISIDNNEVHHLRMLMDGLFGSANFVDMLTWQGGRKGDARLTAGGQDYILIYARDLKYLKSLNTRWRERKTGLEPVYEMERKLLKEHRDDHSTATRRLREWFDSLPEGSPPKQHAHYNQIDADGVWTSDNSSSPNYRENLVYDFKGYPPPENGWRYERATMEQLDRKGRLLYPTGKAKRIRIKKYLHEQEYWAPASTFYRDRSGASSALEQLLDASVFDNPKSLDVLARLISATTGGTDLILDFFGGSGSTGHAVWQQNQEDGHSRRWIVVQAPERPREEEESGANAIDEGYDTIFEITAERLRRASEEFEDAGFRVFRTQVSTLRVDPPIVATERTDGGGLVQMSLGAVREAPVAPRAKALDVAWEVILKATDVPLDARVTRRVIDHICVFEFRRAEAEAPGRLFVSLDEFDLSTAEALAIEDHDTLILRGDKVSDAVTLTLSARLKSRLLLIERAPREVSI